MGKPLSGRDVASFAVIVMFGVSLAATSKPKPDRDEAEDGGRAQVALADAGAADGAKAVALTVDAAAEVPAVAKNAELPDTTDWKPFAYPAGKLAAKTPPNAEVACTKAGELIVCTVTRHAKSLATFTSIKIAPEVVVSGMKLDTTLPSIPVFEDEKNLAVMRNDPAQGAWCEVVASSPAGLTAVVHSPVADAGLQAVTLNRTECLEMIAFGRTLVRTP